LTLVWSHALIHWKDDAPEGNHPMPRPIVLIHGYSDTGASFEAWKDILLGQGYGPDDIHICTYQSLTNEVNIKDIAEALDRALRARIGAGTEFDAIVHSTGMLVVRQWLIAHAPRRGQLKRLIALAPATFGSPLAHKGRGLLGGIFKGRKEFGPDFLEAGDLVLDALELGSRFTWDLTHRDLICDAPIFGTGSDTPYVFIFCGTSVYRGLRRVVNEPGTDGTVRWAGCALTTQKIVIDLIRDNDDAKPDDQRVGLGNIAGQATLPMPTWLIEGVNHGTIMSDPTTRLSDLVTAALKVTDEAGFEAWQEVARNETAKTQDDCPPWQQFVLRAVDERGDPINDYYVEMFYRDPKGKAVTLDFDLSPHVYSGDKSLRCFHINLKDLQKTLKGASPALWVRIVARTGTRMVGYHGINSERLPVLGAAPNEDGVWDAMVPLPETFARGAIKLMYPFTTTFIELRLNRDPTPFGSTPSQVCRFE